jgi:Family of unknown function (DUF5678)
MKIMDFQLYQDNRDSFPIDELRKHDGRWVAFSADGRRIVASAETLDEVERQLVASGEDPEEVGFERIALDDDWQGAELELR